jgi:hypothetical protein
MRKSLKFLLVFLLLNGVCGFTQTLTWTSDWGISNATDVGGTSGRPGAASAQFNGAIWLAYTSKTCIQNIGC